LARLDILTLADFSSCFIRFWICPAVMARKKSRHHIIDEIHAMEPNSFGNGCIYYRFMFKLCTVLETFTVQISKMRRGEFSFVRKFTMYEHSPSLVSGVIRYISVVMADIIVLSLALVVIRHLILK